MDILWKEVIEYPLGEMYEGFCVYDLNEASEKNVVFEGATKLPIDNGEEYFVKVLDYWAGCLQKIIDILPHAQ